MRPPGISVPAKLAAVQMDLGNLGEALTILTDLKNAGVREGRKRTEMDRSQAAWDLYSNLMLRIGHECGKYMRGTGEEHPSYMFRRWLKHYAATFDWGERRTQSLCLAMEAAAGSDACEKLVTWARERARKKEKDNGGEDEDCKGDSGMSTGEGGQKFVEPEGTGMRPENSDYDSKTAFEQERAALIERNRAELAEFDRHTSEMVNLKPGSDEASERETEKADIVRRHKAAVVTLVGEHHQCQKSRTTPGSLMLRVGRNIAKDKESNRTTAPGEVNKGDSDAPTPIPMSASIATVCKIASQLMRQCLALGLHCGVCLAGEATVAYLRKRAERHARRKMWNQKRDLPGLLEAHVDREVGSSDGETDDDDEDQIYLSDDDDLEYNDGGDKVSLIQGLKRGALPPELRVLYSLGLLGKGGSDYEALQGLHAVRDIESQSLTLDDSLWASPIDISDPSWATFRRAAVDPLDRTAALALTADLLRRGQKEEAWSGRLAGLFQEHLDGLERAGALEPLMTDLGSENAEPSSVGNFVRGKQQLKIMLTTLRMQTNKAEALMVSASSLKSMPGSVLEKKSLLRPNQGAVEEVMKLTTWLVSAIPRFQLWNGIMLDGTVSNVTFEVS